MADQFRKSLQLKINSNTHQEPAEPDEVSCDVCTETKLKALKSCLVCLTSYCGTHLEPHQRVTALKRHKLIDPVKNLEDVMCKKHDRPLELFCKTDQMCVCQFCAVSDHKSHHIVSLKEEFEAKKAELGKTEAKVQQMIQTRQLKIQEVKHSAQLSKKVADTEIADSVQLYTALIGCIQRSQGMLVDVIEEKQKTTEKEAEGLVKELQQEIAELKKRSSDLKQLSQSEYHLHLLQNITSINSPPPTKDWTKVNVHQSSYGETVRTAVAQLVNTLSKEMEKKLCGAKLRIVQQRAVDAPGSISQMPVPIPFHDCCDLSHPDPQFTCFTCWVFHSGACRGVDYCLKYHEIRQLRVCPCGKPCSRKPLILCRYCGTEYCNLCWYRNPIACTCGQPFDKSCSL